MPRLTFAVSFEPVLFFDSSRVFSTTQAPADGCHCLPVHWPLDKQAIVCQFGPCSVWCGGTPRLLYCLFSCSCSQYTRQTFSTTQSHATFGNVLISKRLNCWTSLLHTRRGLIDSTTWGSQGPSVCVTQDARNGLFSSVACRRGKEKWHKQTE